MKLSHEVAIASRRRALARVPSGMESLQSRVGIPVESVGFPMGSWWLGRPTFICHSASFGYCFCHDASQVESAFMSSPVIIAALAAGLAGFSPPAISVPSDIVVRVSGDCSAAAAQVVADTGGELLSAQPTSDGQCVITVLVPGNGGRPKKVTVKVPM